MQLYVKHFYVEMSGNVFVNPIPFPMFIPIPIPDPRFRPVLFPFTSHSRRLFPFPPAPIPIQVDMFLPVHCGFAVDRLLGRKDP